MNVNDMPDGPVEIYKKARNEDDKKRLIDKYTESWRQENIDRTVNQHKYMMMRETIFEWLLVLETILVLLILLKSM